MLVDKTRKESCCNLLALPSSVPLKITGQEKKVNGNSALHLEQTRKDADRARIMLLGIKLQLSQRPE